MMFCSNFLGRHQYFWGKKFATLSFPEGISFDNFYPSTELLVVMSQNTAMQSAGKMETYTKEEVWWFEIYNAIDRVII
jgi:hypothetical protein